jgi:hypothetical protein
MKAAYERGAGQPTHPPCRLEILFSPKQVKPWIENNRAIGNETPMRNPAAGTPPHQRRPAAD